MIQKEAFSIPFGVGLDTKTDPFQVQPGKMLALQNSIFDKGGQLKKRNGFSALPALPDSTSTGISTYSGGLIAIGNNVSSLSANNGQWVTKGSVVPMSVSTTSAARTSNNIVIVDSATLSSGISCVAFQDNLGNAYYEVIDTSNGSTIIPITTIQSGASSPRVVILGNYFLVCFAQTTGGTTFLRYLPIPVNNLASPGAIVQLSSQVNNSSKLFDVYVAANNAYFAWSGSDVGGSIRMTYVDSILNQHGTIVQATNEPTLLSITADTTQSTPVIWTSWNEITTDSIYAMAKNQILSPILAKTLVTAFIGTGTGNAGLVTSSANSVLMVFGNYAQADPAGVGQQFEVLFKASITQAGTATAGSILLDTLWIASKSFYVANKNKHYVLGYFQSAVQPSLFLVDQTGIVVAKLAYSNAGLSSDNNTKPSISQNDVNFSFSYLFADLLLGASTAAGSTQNSIYANFGSNIATLEFDSTGMTTDEIASAVHVTGGVLSMYDGAQVVELGFNVFPDHLVGVASSTLGFMIPQIYYYYVTYEWTDNNGNTHRSAPSIPLKVTVGAGTNTNKVTLQIPYLSLTSKAGNNPVRVCIYRQSVAQPVPYLVTNINTPQLNIVNGGWLTYVDTVADTSLVGNLILYTNGGVVEDIAPPACTSSTLYRSRMLVVDAEDQNLIWYSKQVIENTPVEFSDLFTIYVAPTISAQGSTGPISALSAMDDKLIIFKRNAVYYLTGNGPDNTGANNDFSEPVFITSTVGCINQKSVLFTPIGIIFQSDKGIWLLGRDLSTSYIGAEVEQYNSDNVVSAVTIPGTNQIRLCLDNGMTLMYDYYYRQWATFSNVPAISSTIYQGLHTYLNSSGAVFQESIGSYTDNGNPVLVSFTTSWMNLAGLQGFERGYYFYLLGVYYSPHKLSVSIAYDYNSSATQTTLITPTNYSPAYGGDSIYGGGDPYGGSGNVEQWRVFLQKQKCQAFQLQVSEIYDPSFGVAPGAGLTLSGINMVVGVKRRYRPISGSNSVG